MFDSWTMKQDMLQANRQKGIFTQTVATAINEHLRNDLVIRDLIQPALDNISTKIESGIRARLEGFGMF